ncbi:hypothetical protein V5799_003045 [Amblyomma americanum]|uniref:Uncharacterized protein n=1 Tax=Amblyomma americanum TaxID=6943 RepID=A0AAQ4DA29_AMBAM
MLTTLALRANIGSQLGSFLDSPTKDCWRICNAHSYNYQELWRATYVTALTDSAKNAQLHTIFEETRRALVNYEPLRHLMAAGGYTQEFEAFVGNMLSLLLPADLIGHDVSVSSLSDHGFFRNHFRATSFEFDVGATKWRRGMPILRDDLEEGARANLLFVNETSIYVPAPAFVLLSDNTTDPLLADAPVIATRMAALMSYQVAYRKTWSEETKKAISVYR